MTQQTTRIQPLWRFRRGDATARATIVPHTMQTTLLVWINEEIEVADDFQDWSAALERATAVRAGLLRDGDAS